MFQRIQTVFLFLVLVFGLLYLLFPLATIYIGEFFYTLKAHTMQAPEAVTDQLDISLLQTLILIVLFANMLLVIITTFKYKKRLLQIKMGRLNILLLLILIVLSFFYIDTVKEQLSAEISYGVGIFFPFISMILILLANRAIRKDEELVRSVNRIR